MPIGVPIIGHLRKPKTKRATTMSRNGAIAIQPKSTQTKSKQSAAAIKKQSTRRFVKVRAKATSSWTQVLKASRIYALGAVSAALLSVTPVGNYNKLLCSFVGLSLASVGLVSNRVGD